jgi:predicted nucleic acid-binding protein
MKVIMDADSLIKLTKAKAKEVILKNIEVYIPPKVVEETVEIPKEEGYPDAFLIEEKIEAETYINELKEMISDEEYYLAIREVE